MIEKTPEIELVQLKKAIRFLIGLLEEGSLVDDRYHDETREDLAQVLELLVQKVEGLPANVPDNLVQATAVRAIIDASEKHDDDDKEGQLAELEKRMRDAEAAASVQGHILTEWEPVPDSPGENQATCQNCGGFIYVSADDTFNLLLESCQRL